MASFSYAGQLNGAENPVIRVFPIKNSASVAVGEALGLNAGADTCGSISAVGTDPILGICVGIVDSNGLGLDNTSTTLDGTWVSSTKTYTAANDNVTVAKVMAQVICDKNALFKNDADADMTVLMLGYKFNLVSGTQIDGDTNVLEAGQFELVKLDPEDASVGFFKICESTTDAYAQQ